jgi:flagellar biosynthetic protein FliR
MILTLPLETLLTYMMIYVRISAAFLFLPFFSYSTISIRIRILFAMVLAVFFSEHLNIKTLPTSLMDGPFLIFIAKEALIGLCIGAMAQLAIVMFDVAGQVFSFQIGLSNAMAFNPMIHGQTNVLSNGLMMGFMLVFISLDLHHFLLKGMAKSYAVFPPGQGGFRLENITYQVIENITLLFSLALQITLPFLLGGVIFQFILGLFNRVMPQIQIFFISLPLQIILGFGLMVFTLSGAYLIYSSALKNQPTLLFIRK